MDKYDLMREFDSVLEDIRAGKGVRTETGLDESVEAALMSYNEDPLETSLLEQARKSFEKQLSGDSGRIKNNIMGIALARTDANGRGK